jgi:DNA polymerase III, subunit gamma and tau
MSGYTALYRKFRPDVFEDVKGQEHIVATLKNQIKANRIGHAYLFCGTRGTGKTTMAKIFAKSVNCENPKDGSPCNECISCRTIASGASMNVIEIDAASNNGVENIREIRDEVAYSPTEGKYKVYIIDEVHMLSIGAFNALLKTLEEPPSYVIFILATTEAHKLPITILSRCQRYDLRRITIDIIADRLFSLMELEKIEVEEKAIYYIAKKADGALRDALSLLDQCIAFYLNETLTYDNVLEILGGVEADVFSKILREIIKQDIVAAIHELEALVMQGRELGQFVTDFIWYMRNLLLVKTSDNIEEVLDVSTETLKQMQEEAKLIESETLMRYIRIFSELSNQIKYASQKRVLIEIALIKLCKPAMETNMDSILDRIRVMEKQLEEGVVIAQAIGTPNVEAKAQNLPSNPKEEQINDLAKAAPVDLQNVKANWKSIVNQMEGKLKILLNGVTIKYNRLDENDNKLFIVFNDFIGGAVTKDKETKALIEKIIANKIGKKVEVEMIVEESEKDLQLVNITVEQALSDFIHTNIVVEDVE